MADPWEGYADGRNWREVADALEEGAGEPSYEPAREEADTRPQRASGPEGDAVTLMACARRLSEAQSVDEVIDATLTYASGRLSRTMMFVARGGHAVAWSGSGWPQDAVEWRRVELPLHEGGPAIFSVVPDGVPHFLGPVAGQPWASAFYATLAAPPPRTALLIPIRLKGRPAAWLYADGGDAFALQIMILRNKILAA
jgi:hypothetical protein